MKRLHISFVVLTVLSICLLAGAFRLLYELPLSTSVIRWIGTAVYVLMTILFLVIGSVGRKIRKEIKYSNGRKAAVIIANIIILLDIICSLYVSASAVVSSIKGFRSGTSGAFILMEFVFVPPVVPYVIYIIVGHMNKTESMMTEEEVIVKRSFGGAMIIWGWILSVIGAVGSVISGIAYGNAKEDYENRIYSFYSHARSDMQVAQIALFICLGVLILGVILLVAGYISRSQKQSDIRTEKIMQQLVNNNQNNIAPAVNIPVYTEEKAGVSCPNCGYKNTEGAKFCNSCGQKLVSGKTCSACGFENAATAKFCKNCGNKFAAEEEE